VTYRRRIKLVSRGYSSGKIKTIVSDVLTLSTPIAWPATTEKNGRMPNADPE
jgi:hypothetical protein